MYLDVISINYLNAFQSCIYYLQYVYLVANFSHVIKGRDIIRQRILDKIHYIYLYYI